MAEKPTANKNGAIFGAINQEVINLFGLTMRFLSNNSMDAGSTNQTKTPTKVGFFVSVTPARGIEAAGRGGEAETADMN